MESYYQQLAPYYKYFYNDWEASVRHQAAVLGGVIQEFIGKDSRNILDAACGVGTQSIGLAELGYHVAASDLSSAALEMARNDASKRGLKIEFKTADMRSLSAAYTQQFDVVIACDNAVPHLLSDADILTAFSQFYQCTRPGGGCIVSVRDYDSFERGPQRINARTVHELAGGRLVIFDVWEFEGDFYEMTTYVMEDQGLPTARTQVIRGGKYYCVTIPTLEKLLVKAGFEQVRILRDRFFQPLLVAKRPLGDL